ncbi:MAG: UvrB/UvrC motif-containing protein [Patescibacteria group bacterium]
MDKFISKKNISKLPNETGVYIFKKGKEIIYIGKAANIRERARNHFQQPTFRDNLFINQISKIGYIETDSEIEALILEAKLIKKHQPKFNVMWRDDKNYFYVGMTKEAFPQIFITHQVKNINTKDPPSLKLPLAVARPRARRRASKILNTRYVGPFVDGRALKETLKFLRKVFPFRSCRFLPKKSCLWYHLARCPAPCTLKSKILDVPKIRENLEKEAQKDAVLLFGIISGKKPQVLKNLKKDMRTASKNQDFEKAARIRNRAWSLEKILANARIFEQQALAPLNDWQKTGIILQKIIGGKPAFAKASAGRQISRIEAYDVSNIQGQEATGSMVVFIGGKPYKNHYRKFKIKITNKPDDTAMIKEILSRRFLHPEWGWPDLVLIDGGKGQLNAALSIARNPNFLSRVGAHVEPAGEMWGKARKKLGFQVISLAKKHNELFIQGKKKTLLLKNLPREISNLILHLRDEAHRFAISYHKKLRQKTLFND